MAVVRGWEAGLCLATAVAVLSGCAAGSYGGVPLAPGAADVELQQMARRAKAGNKNAQLDLANSGDTIPISN